MSQIVCGICQHGTPIEYGMIQCQLGWEAHDGLSPTYSTIHKKKLPTHMGHGGLAKPEATPDCRCGAKPVAWKRRAA